jgi:hypothetical protein
MTGIVKCLIANKEIHEVSFIPALITKTFEPEPLSASDGRFDDVKNYMEKITRDQNLNTRFQTRGDEMVILTD